MLYYICVSIYCICVYVCLDVEECFCSCGDKWTVLCATLANAKANADCYRTHADKSCPNRPDIIIQTIYTNIHKCMLTQVEVEP